MKIQRAGMRAFALPLVRPIATAHGTLQTRTGFLVSVEDAAGRVAHAEATPFAEFGTEDLASCGAALRRGLSAWLAQAPPEGRASFPPASAEWAGEGKTPCARAALEAAWCDLHAQAEGVSLASWMRRESGLGGDALRTVSVQALVQGATPGEVAASARAAMGEGFGTFKLKLATHSGRGALGIDLERVAALREAVGSAARLRLDANEAWTRGEAEQALARLAEFQIDYVEQPVAREALTDLAALSRLGGVAVAADEALLGDGLGKCLEARAASIFVVKPAALGGVSAALDLVRRARAADVRMIWSNLFEGVVGRSLALALAAATSESDEVQGLGTAGLLAQDLDDELEREVHGGELCCASVRDRARAVLPAWSESPSRADAKSWDGEIWEAEA